MTYRNSNYTGRAPRDLQSAFGPYTSGKIEEDGSTPFGWQEVVVVIASLIAFWVLVALAVWPE